MLTRFLCTIAVLTCLLLHPLSAGATDKTAGTGAAVTYLSGAAEVVGKDITAPRKLKQGDFLRAEHEVKVGERSRMEIRFPDGTVMRLSERSRLVMSEIHYDKKTENKNMKVNLGVGKLWANVKKLLTPGSSVEVKTSNAVAGVRGTVYRVNVDEDKSAMVKVYDGSVYVAGAPATAASGPPVQVSAPVPVPGPHEVPPPVHQVSMEEWHVIVKSMQQVTISPQGIASPPTDFDVRSDTDDWVKWNQERDKELRL